MRPSASPLTFSAEIGTPVALAMRKFDAKLDFREKPNLFWFTS